MLSLQLKTGDYMTIGEDVVVQLDHISGDRCKLMIQAPKDMTILRGEVLERTGGERPECVFDGPRRHRQEVIWNRGKTRALNSIRLVLSGMENGEEDVPDYYITMGPRSIMQAKNLVMIASGKRKAEPVKKLMSGVVDEKVPATVLTLHPHFTLILDEEAASLL